MDSYSLFHRLGKPCVIEQINRSTNKTRAVSVPKYILYLG